MDRKSTVIQTCHLSVGPWKTLDHYGTPPLINILLFNMTTLIELLFNMINMMSMMSIIIMITDRGRARLTIHLYVKCQIIKVGTVMT